MTVKKPEFKNLRETTDNLAMLLKKQAAQLKETADGFVKALEAKARAKETYIKRKRDI